MEPLMHRILCAFALTAFLIFPGGGAAWAVEAMTLKVSRLGDTEMSCNQLSQEAVLMRDIIITTEDIQDDTELKGHGITAAGAVGSFLIGSATGGVGLAAAGLLLSHVNDEQAEEAGSIQDTAEQRRALMLGIYNAKGCFGPVEHALRDGRPAPADAIIQIAAVEPASGGQGTDTIHRHKPQYNQ